MLVSLVVPAFNEADNLSHLRDEVAAAFSSSAAIGLTWEMIVVDDHSNDRTPQVIDELSRSDPRVRGVRLARNSGSHNAVRCGLQRAGGDIVGIIAADLQDPPEVLVSMVGDLLREGHNIVWAVRERREGISFSDRLFSLLFHSMMRRIMGRTDMPAMGADFVIFDRRVADALRGMREANANIFGLIQWAGFRQAYVNYVKQQRRSGVSGWSPRKKLRLVVDSVIGFSYVPIRIISLVGVLTAFGALLYALVVFANFFLGAPAEGWSSLMIVVLFIGGVNLIGMGMLGEYIWRALDEIRGRAPFLIEAEFPGAAGYDRSGHRAAPAVGATRPQDAAIERSQKPE